MPFKLKFFRPPGLGYPIPQRLTLDLGRSSIFTESLPIINYYFHQIHLPRDRFYEILPSCYQTFMFAGILNLRLKQKHWINHG
ncbi:hypothetical protein NDI52_00325 [Leptolyngbya sp. PL-A3]